MVIKNMYKIDLEVSCQTHNPALNRMSFSLSNALFFLFSFFFLSLSVAFSGGLGMVTYKHCLFPELKQMYSTNLRTRLGSSNKNFPRTQKGL